jgi:DNA polymerase V
MEKQPVVVLSNNDGCVISRSDEAKKLGIKMGVPIFEVRDLVEKNKVNVFSSNYNLYGNFSKRVMESLAYFTPDIEIYSIDEAFLDLSKIIVEDKALYGNLLKTKIKQWTGIPVSVGIAQTKTLAKIANHLAKKSAKLNGVFDLTNSDLIDEALERTPVYDVWGVGRQYGKLLVQNNIKTALDLKNTDDAWIRKHLHVVGLRTVFELRGASCLSINDVPSGKKGICTSRSFGKPLDKYEDVEQALAAFVVRCAEKLRKQKSAASAVTVFIMTNKYASGPKYVNSMTIQLPVATNLTSELIKYAMKSLKIVFRKGYKYKKAGIIITDIISEDQIQQDFWDNVDRGKNKKIMDIIDKTNKSMGRDKIKFAVQGYNRKWKMNQEHLSPNYTTRWKDLLVV